MTIVSLHEFDVVKSPHPHPLIFYQHGKPDGPVVSCSKCRQPWRPPAFGCSDCNFLIHQSCLDLSLNIHTSFHPHHRLPLSLTTNNNLCNCCGQMPYGDVYRCPECSFQIDIQCAIVVDTKASSIRQITKTGEFRHFSHPHPLTLVQEQDQEQQRGNRKVACLLCQWYIESGNSTYFCSLCDSHFHPQCAEMPRQILNRDFHDHPLFLFSLPWVHNTLCDNCKDKCNGFFYGCALCNFNLHLHCLSSFKHQHNFKHFKKVVPGHECQVCGKLEGGVVDWYCSECNLLAHRKCTELPPILQTSQHDHLLALTYRLDLAYSICKICGMNINTFYAGYVCRDCTYAAHLSCAINLQIHNTEGENSISTEPVDPNYNDLNLENGILHFSHEHKLTLWPFEDNKHCNGCMQCISTQSYGCPPCGFYLHEECAILPRQHMNSSFHSHELSMVYIPDFIFSCAVCRQYCHGFAYHCEKCHYTIDIRCALLKFPFTHPSHHHPLSQFQLIEEKYVSCSGCGKVVINDLVFRCDNDCKFYLDTSCAHLPVAVRNRFDEHPLSLTFVNNEDEEGDECYCDICEEEREEDEWFYSCKLCCFAVHINCVLGDYPFLKSAKFEGHQHPLSLVGEGKTGYSACGECGYSCEDNLTFQCGDLSCKFNVHAFGPCYHYQLAQGRITFTMPSLRYRSVTLYLNSIQRKRSKPIVLGWHRGRGGSPGNERVFSAIRQFMVNQERWVDSIQIQYEEIEKSFWSTKHAQNGDFKSKKDEEYVGKKVAMSLGQHGGGGNREIKWDDGAFPSIKRVVITHEQRIHSIQVEYFDDNYGTSIWSERRGGNGGILVDQVELQHPEEYLISIHGCMTFLGRFHVIGTLILESNKKIYGPFGDKQWRGIKFWFPSSGGKIVGFHGRCNYYLNSIGVKVVPIHNHNS